MTMALWDVDDPTQFGIVGLSSRVGGQINPNVSEGYITKFLEKPSLEDAFSKVINAGLYIIEPEVLEHIPFDTKYDLVINDLLASFYLQEIAEDGDTSSTSPFSGYMLTFGSEIKYDAKGLLKSAIRDNDPVIFMESEQMYGDKGEVPEEEYLIPIGKAEVKIPGKDVTIVSFGKILKEASKAIDELKKEGIEAELIDLRTIRPLDINTILESVKKTNRLVILEESWPFGNISTEITYQVQNQIFDYLDAPIEKINTADTPAPYSPVLLAEWIPNSQDVIKSVKKVLYK